MITDIPCLVTQLDIVSCPTKKGKGKWNGDFFFYCIEMYKMVLYSPGFNLERKK
jgi:hypothetical protein